ncbi:MAG: ABC transporter permease subunit [Chloroflexi bacterium]|nr:ABC transporter permease subunit [Chloroflexota bacterium]
MQSILYPGGIPLWRNVVFIQWVVQIVSAIIVIAIVSGFIFNVANEIQDREIPFGFSFLDEAAQIPIGESVIEYDPSESYLYGFTVAALNTIKASVLGVIIATLLGIVIGVARLSSNWLLSKLALVYIETFRNIPLLIQLLFWFLIILELPNVREGYVFFDTFYLNNSGFYLPWASPLSGFWPWAILTLIGIVGAITAFNFLNRREIETGKPSYPIVIGFLIFIAATIIGLIIFTPLDVVSPERQEGPFGRLQGGARLTGSFFALLIGLVIYTSAFIAEIVRAGIQAVNRGQTEASRALGLHTNAGLRYVIFPQALRVIIPPLISQYLNLTKNSSLAAAIGYPDLVSVSTTMTQIAPAISLIGMVMVTYLAMSLFYSLVGNIYNRVTKYAGVG